MSDRPSVRYFETSEDLRQYVTEHVDDFEQIDIQVVENLVMGGPRDEAARNIHNCCAAIQTCNGELNFIHREHLQDLMNQGVLERLKIRVSLVPHARS